MLITAALPETTNDQTNAKLPIANSYTNKPPTATAISNGDGLVLTDSLTHIKAKAAMPTNRKNKVVCLTVSNSIVFPVPVPKK